jgi:hypothetical protein
LALQEGDIYNGDVSFITTTGYISAAFTGVSEFRGNINTNSNHQYGIIVFNQGSGTVSLTGTGNQILSGDTTLLIGKLVADKGSGTVTLNRAATIDSALTLTSGKIITTATNLLTLKSTCTLTGGNSLSYIEGPIRKNGNSAFSFPVGKSSIYRPIEISAPSVSSDAFTAEYFYQGQAFGNSTDTSIKVLNSCNYWNLARTAGTSNVTVKLSWDTIACPLNDSNSVRVANWNGSTWKDLGNGGITGNRYVGEISNSTSIVTYGNFTLCFGSCLMTAYTLSSGDTVKVKTLNGVRPNTFLWSTGSTDSTALGFTAGANYTVTVTDGKGCMAIANITRLFTKLTEGGLVNEGNNSYYATWGDYDNDGDLDLYHSVFFASPNNTSGNNLLFRNNCNSSLTRVTNIPGGLVTNGLVGNSSVWVDYNNDGNLDLYVGAKKLYENQGNGSFLSVSKTITSLPIYSPTIRDMGFADYDNDGYLDAYFGKDKIYRNNHSGNFIETTIAGISNVSGTNRADAVSWADYNNDGFMDVFVANSNPYEDNFLFKNNGNSTFSKILTSTVLTNYQNSYGCAWGDYDNDGDLDVWLNNNVNGDKLITNNGNGTFTENTLANIKTRSSVKQGGASWADYNNDGYLDLFVPTFDKNYLFKNNGNGTFSKDSIEIISSDVSVESYAGAWADYDNDGDLDLFVPTGYGHPNDLFYINNLNAISSPTHNWFKINCEGIISNKDAIGARVYVKATIDGVNRWQMREINANTSRGGENGATSGHVVHIGLCNATTIDSLKIVWPASNTIQYFTNVALNRFVKVKEGINVLTDVAACNASLPLSNSGSISGRVYNDVDSNCIYTAGIDYPIANKPVMATPGAYYAFTNDSGQYVLNLPNGNYNIKLNYQNDNFFMSTCQSDSVYEESITSNTILINRDFAQQFLLVPCSPRYVLNFSSVAIDHGNCDDNLMLQNACPGNKIRYCFDITNLSSAPSPAGTLLNILLPTGFVIDNIQSVSGAAVIVAPYPTTGSNTISIALGQIPVMGSGSVCVDVKVSLFWIPGMHTIRASFGNVTSGNLINNGDFDTPTTYTNLGPYVFKLPPPPSLLGSFCVTGNPNTLNIPWWNGSAFSAPNALYVDASLNPTSPVNPIPVRPVWCQTINVNPNTQYDFSMQFTNLTYYGSLPIGIVSIDGLDIYNTGAITFNGANAWTQGNVQWCTNAITTATNVNLCLRVESSNNNNAGGVDAGFDNLSFTEVSAVMLRNRRDACGCDPNDKIVTPQGCGPNGNIEKLQELDYTIRFLNIGSGKAHNIIISDQIDSNLNINTFKFLGASHRVTNISINPNNILLVEFDSIELAPDSIGYIHYVITPKQGLNDGTKITNQAGIYFDNNEVVLTNTTLNTVYDIPNPESVFTSKHNCNNSGLSYDFTYQGNTPDNALYLWTFEGGSPSTSTLQNPADIIFDSIGYKTITLTVYRNGCEAISKDTILIEDVVNSNDSLYVCNGGELFYISIDSLDTWLNYGACVGVCANDVSRIGKSNKLDKINFEVLLAPNPTTSSCVISINSTKQNDENVVIKLYNYYGHALKTIQLPALDQANKSSVKLNYILNTEDLSPGVYLIETTYGNLQKSIKLIIQ